MELLSFTAKPVNNKTVITEWITTTEVNSDYFTVERSKNARLNEEVGQAEEGTWEYVGTVDAAGNSTTTLNYSLEDKQPYMGTSYYRLKQTDFNGDYKYYGPVPVRLEGIDIISLYPNPATDHFEYLVVSSMQDEVVRTLTDVLGRNVYIEINEVQDGENKFNLRIPDLSSGMYLIQLKTGSGKYRTQKQFVVR